MREVSGLWGRDQSRLWCFTDVLFTSSVALVPVAVVGVLDDGIELIFGAGFEVGFAVVVGVGEEFGAFEEAFFVASGEDIDEDCFDMLAEFSDEPGDGGMVRAFTTKEGHEADVVLAGVFDLSRGEDAL